MPALLRRRWRRAPPPEVREPIPFSFEPGQLACLVVPRRRVTLLRDRVGVVFQEDRLLPWRTLRDNIALVMRPFRYQGGEPSARAVHALQLVGLNGFERHYPGEVDAAIRQRVAIARAFAIEPDVVLMDDPFSALDAQARRALRREVRRIRDKTGQTIVFATPSAEEAAEIGGVIIDLSDAF